jgi:hypothetical protein
VLRLQLSGYWAIDQRHHPTLRFLLKTKRANVLLDQGGWTFRPFPFDPTASREGHYDNVKKQNAY